MDYQTGEDQMICECCKNNYLSDDPEIAVHGLCDLCAKQINDDFKPIRE
jgi:hypothetical protein